MSLLDIHPVVLVTGISASGKSTVSELLARRFDRGVHVKGDVFRRMVVSGRDERYVEGADEAWQQLRLRYRLGAETANAYHDAGFSVVVQDVVLGQVLAEYVALITARPLAVVVLAPRLEVVARREAARPKTAYRDEDEMASLERWLRADTPRIGLWIDNSDQSPDETVDEIVQRAATEGLVG